MTPRPLTLPIRVEQPLRSLMGSVNTFMLSWPSDDAAAYPVFPHRGRALGAVCTVFAVDRSEDAKSFAFIDIFRAARYNIQRFWAYPKAGHISKEKRSIG